MVPDSLAETRAKAGYRCIGDVMQLPGLGCSDLGRMLVCDQGGIYKYILKPGSIECIGRHGLLHRDRNSSDSDSALEERRDKWRNKQRTGRVEM